MSYRIHIEHIETVAFPDHHPPRWVTCRKKFDLLSTVCRKSVLIIIIIIITTMIISSINKLIKSNQWILCCGSYKGNLSWFPQDILTISVYLKCCISNYHMYLHWKKISVNLSPRLKFKPQNQCRIFCLCHDSP